MTNEEKAKEIATENKMTYLLLENDGGVYDVDSFNECVQSAIEMAQWKDKQFIGLLDTLNYNAFSSHEDYVKYIKTFIGAYDTRK